MILKSTLPKSEKEMNKLQRLVRYYPLISMLGMLSIVLPDYILSTDAFLDASDLTKIFTTASFFILGLSFLYLLVVSTRLKDRLKYLSDTESEEYIALCKEHPLLMSYAKTLERKPVMMELYEFREFQRVTEKKELADLFNSHSLYY
ncbi:MAG: hypothetical protein IBX55_00465 [Methyloprofundus sp.]|nr:hypothetical protein [Methyloprofundus sp.]